MSFIIEFVEKLYLSLGKIIFSKQEDKFVWIYRGNDFKIYCLKCFEKDICVYMYLRDKRKIFFQGDLQDFKDGIIHIKFQDNKIAWSFENYEIKDEIQKNRIRNDILECFNQKGIQIMW